MRVLKSHGVTELSPEVVRNTRKLKKMHPQRKDAVPTVLMALIG